MGSPVPWVEAQPWAQGAVAALGAGPGLQGVAASAVGWGWVKNAEWAYVVLDDARFDEDQEMRSDGDRVSYRLWFSGYFRPPILSRQLVSCPDSGRTTLTIDAILLLSAKKSYFLLGC